jgi:hypothetical protein
MEIGAKLKKKTIKELVVDFYFSDFEDILKSYKRGIV